MGAAHFLLEVFVQELRDRHVVEAVHRAAITERLQRRQRGSNRLFCMLPAGGCRPAFPAGTSACGRCGQQLQNQGDEKERVP